TTRPPSNWSRVKKQFPNFLPESAAPARAALAGAAGSGCKPLLSRPRPFGPPARGGEPNSSPPAADLVVPGCLPVVAYGQPGERDDVHRGRDGPHAAVGQYELAAPRMVTAEPPVRPDRLGRARQRRVGDEGEVALHVGVQSVGRRLQPGGM